MSEQELLSIINEENGVKNSLTSEHFKTIKQT